MTAYLYQAPIGFAGDVTRVDETNIEPVKFTEANCPAVYGFPYVYESGVPKKWAGSNVAADFAGILSREVPTIAASSASDALLNAVPNYQQVMGGVPRGYMAVKCAAGTPARGGVVYIQITANGGVAVGEFRADGTDGGNAVALTLTQASWAADGKGPDGNGNTNIAEIRVAR